MKRLLWTMLAWVFGIALSLGFASAASSDCLNFSFNNWDSMCLGISKNGTKNFEISVDKNNLSKGSELKCYVILENSSMRTLNNCKWTFSYAGSSTEDVIINATYVLKNKDFYSKRISTEINFSKGTWGTNHNLITSSKSSSKKSSSSSKNSSNDLEVSVSPSNPDTYEWVKLNIETDDDYVGKINFSRFQYKSSSSSSWSNISRTSSTYVSDYSNEWSDGYYRMTSSDDGDVTLKNLVKFKKSGYYRIYVEDTDGNESYVQINVDTSSSSSSSSSSYNDEIKLSTNRKSPSTSQYVNLTIETDEDYVGRLSLSAKYRKSSSDSWSSISNTSSSYFTDYSDEWENGFYRMTSDDDGEITLGDLVKFKKSGYYRIYVKDYDGNESYVQFDVDAASSSNNNDELKVSVSPSNPDTYDWIDITVKTDADYDARIKISKLQYRSSSSDSWSNISNITSSTYVSDYSSTWSSSYRRIVTDEDGEATLEDIVKFKKAGYYRIYVEDTDNNESYVQVNVDTSSSSSSNRYYGDEIELSTDRKSPSTSQYINLTIETEDENYVGKLYLLAKYRSSTSKNWSNISNTSSTYFSDYSDEWENGYYRMTSSDDGEVTLKNLVKFRKEGYYRISVIDIDGNESYLEFSVGDVDESSSSSSKNSISWFSSKELAKVKSVYNKWDTMISQMKKEYPSLKKDTYWTKLSDTFYNNMKDVVNNKKSRNFEDYDDYVKAFNSRYKYTTQNR